MGLKECYEELGGNYEVIVQRLLTEERVEKFVLKFLEDKSFENLCSSMEAGNLEDAFRAAHTLKGVAVNLSFDKLFKSSDEITELLRSKSFEEALKLLPQVKEDYNQTVGAINKIKK